MYRFRVQKCTSFYYEYQLDRLDTMLISLRELTNKSYRRNFENLPRNLRYYTFLEKINLWYRISFISWELDVNRISVAIKLIFTKAESINFASGTFDSL